MQVPRVPGRRESPWRRVGLTTATSALLGMPVGAAVPLQRHHPGLVMALSGAELAALAALVITADAGALIALAAVALALVAQAATNRRRVVAITSGGVVLLAASARGRPLVPLGPAPADLSLPAPSGLGVPVVLEGTPWWVERSAFARLRQARQLLGRGQGDR